MKFVQRFKTIWIHIALTLFSKEGGSARAGCFVNVKRVARSDGCFVKIKIHPVFAELLRLEDQGACGKLAKHTH